MKYVSSCKTCGVLPDTMTVNTGRDFEFPEVWYTLDRFVPGSRLHRRCPECRAWFEQWEEPQMYGSGNEDCSCYRRLDAEEAVQMEATYQATLRARSP